MKTSFVRFLSLALCLILVMGLFPTSVFADTGNLGSGTPDGNAPVLTGMTLSVTTVTAPATINVTLSATDDVSGISGGDVLFFCAATGKTLYCSLSSTYWDSTTGKRIPYADGMLHGTLEIDQYMPASTFDLEHITIYDVADNASFYYREYNSQYAAKNEHPLPDFVTQRKIIVTDSAIPDSASPTFHNITLSATNVTAPATINVTLSATDDVSGISGGDVLFFCAATGKTLYCSLSSTYWDSTTGKRIPYADGMLHGTLEIDQYMPAGTFDLEHITIYDVADNTSFYYREYNSQYAAKNEHPLPDSLTHREIHVTCSATPDSTAPTLTGFSLASFTVAAPSKLEVTIAATDDVSGISGGDVLFFCAATGKTLYCSLSSTYWDSTTGKRIPYADGMLHGTLEIDQYMPAGTFDLEHITIYDVADNASFYYREYNSQYAAKNEHPLPDFVTKQFNVLNAVPDVSTSLAKEEFVSQVQNAGDDAYIVADYSGEATLPDTAFTAIAGTNKTLDLVSEGVTWRFNGNDIVNDAKPIDLEVEIKPVEEHPSEAAQQIQVALEDKPAVVMQFPENGQLPGKATIQVKVDYAMLEYLGSNRDLCVYYYNNQTGKLELVADHLVVINDTYVEFSITHCSNYVLTMRENKIPFVDVPMDKFFYEPVVWAYTNNITTGKDATHFNPSGSCTRAQVVTFLWRAAGEPEPTSTANPFPDVANGKYYTKAVLWAVEKGITAGFKDGTFGPNKTCTRAQIVTFLWRYMQEPDPNSSANTFPDVDISAYYGKAVLWAVEKGITTGFKDGTFGPNKTCTRDQIVTFLFRAIA